MGYTLASFFLKQGLQKGATPMQLNLWSNIAMGLLVQPLWRFDSPEIPNTQLILPLLAATSFFVGQLFTFAALSKGDVSVVTPLLGTKVLGVTLLNALVFSMPISIRWWIAAGAASIGIAVIAGVVPKGQGRSVLMASLWALGAAVAFSLTDVLVQHWSGGADPWAFLPTMFGWVAVLSVLWCSVVDRGAFFPPKKSRLALAVGACILALQASLVFLAITFSRDATATNIIYGGRALLTVLAAWSLGRFFGLKEGEMTAGLLAFRLVGAMLLFASILLVVAG